MTTMLNLTDLCLTLGLVVIGLIIGLGAPLIVIPLVGLPLMVIGLIVVLAVALTALVPPRLVALIVTLLVGVLPASAADLGPAALSPVALAVIGVLARMSLLLMIGPRPLRLRTFIFKSPAVHSRVLPVQ